MSSKLSCDYNRLRCMSLSRSLKMQGCGLTGSVTAKDKRSMLALYIEGLLAIAGRDRLLPSASE
eukprot:3761617-Amphidinium_carterae.1